MYEAKYASSRLKEKELSHKNSIISSKDDPYKSTKDHAEENHGNENESNLRTLKADNSEVLIELADVKVVNKMHRNVSFDSFVSRNQEQKDESILNADTATRFVIDLAEHDNILK